MTCSRPLDVVDGPPVIELAAAHRDDVLALTALVYPHYFRARTMELGRYFGIYQDGRLAAMIGERLGTDTATEVSAICTHPDFTGRGYARRLTAMLSNDLRARGLLPFLHVSHGNPRALQLYRQLGFEHRRDIGFWSLRRAP
jgi:predicted GNAT family acetyltransferase